jgi:hypothetical protein
MWPLPKAICFKSACAILLLAGWGAGCAHLPSGRIFSLQSASGLNGIFKKKKTALEGGKWFLQ